MTEYIVEGRTHLAGEVGAFAEKLAATLPHRAELAVHGADRLALLCTLIAGERCDCRVQLAPGYWSTGQFNEWLETSGASWLVHGGSSPSQLELTRVGLPRDTESAGVVMFTSGSTGKPKAVAHSWDSIAVAASFTNERLRGKTWYLAYEPSAYAGLQVIYAARGNKGRLVLPPHGVSFADAARLIAQHGVSVLSATPTWWRLLISSWPQDLAVPRLHQATLGGELADQSTLDLVARFFEPENLTHVYASSEAGTVLAVSDRLAGFPASCLDDELRRIQLRVRDDVLEVRSPYRMRGYVDSEDPPDSEWIRTGDLIEAREGRCYFAGREDQQLNIGGLKVKPEEVEQALRQLPDIDDCVAYGRPNAIMGTLLVADVVGSSDSHIDASGVREQLKPLLPPHKIPQHIRFVKALSVSAHGKKQRG